MHGLLEALHAHAGALVLDELAFEAFGCSSGVVVVLLVMMVNPRLFHCACVFISTDATISAFTAARPSW